MVCTMVAIGSRWQPGHVVRIDTRAGTFEEINPPCDRDDERRLQTALLKPEPVPATLAQLLRLRS